MTYRRRHFIAQMACYSGIVRLASTLQRLLGLHIRAVNYHSVPTRLAASFEQQLCYYRTHYVPCGLRELELLLDGAWPYARPGILLTFDDGLADNAQVAAPLLEKYGFEGWFCIPTGFVDCPAASQASFCEQHAISAAGAAMSWDQIRLLARRHALVAHGHWHRRLGAGLSEEELRQEILLPKLRIEEETGRACNAFCWVGGEEWAYSRRAAELIAEAGYTYALMTNSCPITHRTHPRQLQRTNIEADWPLALMRLQLSGLQDLRYAGKRRRVNRATRVSEECTN